MLHLHCHFLMWQVTENAVTPTPIQIFNGFADVILRFKILGNRLGTLTQILIAIDYFFYLYISDKYLQFRKKKYINLDNQFHYKKYNEKDRHISKTFVFIFRHSIQHEASGYTFYKKEKHLLWKIFGSPHISKWIFLLRNCFSNYVYLNNMYITLKGIGKIVLVSVLKTLLICKFLNFMAAFTKKIKLSKVCIQFSV